MFVLRLIVLALFVLGILPSLIVLKADLEGPSSLRDLLLDRSKLPDEREQTGLRSNQSDTSCTKYCCHNTNNARTINRNTNTKVTGWSQSVCHTGRIQLQVSEKRK